MDSVKPANNYYGLILAAGTSSRMGYPKALLPIGDSFFLLRVYETFRAGGVGRLLIVINKGILDCIGDDRRKLFKDAEFITNFRVEAGQMHSLQLGVKCAAALDAAGLLVGLADIPWVKVETICALLEKARLNPQCIIAPRFEGQHGHPFLIPNSHFQSFLNATGTAKDVMHSLSAETIYADVEDSNILKDADAPEDLVQ